MHYDSVNVSKMSKWTEECFHVNGSETADSAKTVGLGMPKTGFMHPHLRKKPASFSVLFRTLNIGISEIDTPMHLEGPF